MFHYKMQFYLALVLSTAVGISLAQEVVFVGGPCHSPGSTIQTTLSRKLTFGVLYNIAWKFDDIIVCVISVPFGSIDNANCDGATYYNKHSDISATLSSNSFLEAVFTYSNAREENRTISVSVSDTSAGDIYGETNLTVKAKFSCVTFSTPTLNIIQPISVGSNPEISVDVATSSQAADVWISLDENPFKTVHIRSTSITISDIGSASYDSRVSVTYEVITANTNVKVKITFISIQKVDDGLVIKFEHSSSDVVEATFSLKVQYCDSAFFEPTALSIVPSTTCGNGCTEQFRCNSTFRAENFTAQCQDTASWNATYAPCTKACDNSFFTNAVVADDSIVGNGESKNFNCNCGKPVASFTRTCGSGGQWSNQTNPCSLVCSADIITCGSPIEDGLLCGGKKHQFKCNGDLVCEPTTFELECHASGNWVNTTCNCQKDCNSLFFEPNATIINSSDTCGNGREQTFQCNRPFEPSSFTARCSDNSMWNLTETPCKISEKPLCIVPVVCKEADRRMNKRGWKDIDEIKQKALTHRLRLQFGDILKEISDDYRYVMSKFEKVKKEFELIPKKP